MALESYAVCYWDDLRFTLLDTPGSIFHACPPGPGSIFGESDYASEVGPIVKFLDDCIPPMVHLAPAVLNAGVNREIDLRALAKWTDAQMSRFFNSNGIGRSPFEVDVLIRKLVSLVYNTGKMYC